MARYIGPKCKKCRKSREKLFLRGDKCLSDKCTLMKRGEMPEVRGRRRASAYSIQLREKQKLRMMYGILETQFHNYFTKAAKSRNTAATLVILLERRLDNVVFRMGFANSRGQARQFVRHGLITVNGRRVNIPSYLTDAGDIIDKIELFEDGTAIQTDEPNSNRRRWRTTFKPRPGKHYYFVKITQKDENLMWSAPVWVTIE